MQLTSTPSWTAMRDAIIDVATNTLGRYHKRENPKRAARQMLPEDTRRQKEKLYYALHREEKPTHYGQRA